MSVAARESLQPSQGDSIGTDGKICINTKAATHLIIDTNGYTA